jgi:hypothetical protein
LPRDTTCLQGRKSFDFKTDSNSLDATAPGPLLAVPGVAMTRTERDMNPTEIARSYHMRFPIAGLIVIPLLALCACSTQVSPSAFCTDVNAASVQFAGLQDQATKPMIQGAAKAMAHLADEAPSQIRSAVKVEAAAYREWAKTGSNAPMTQNSFTAADDQLSTWLHLNCKGH